MNITCLGTGVTGRSTPTTADHGACRDRALVGHHRGDPVGAGLDAEHGRAGAERGPEPPRRPGVAEYHELR